MPGAYKWGVFIEVNTKRFVPLILAIIQFFNKEERYLRFLLSALTYGRKIQCLHKKPNTIQTQLEEHKIIKLI